jgi:hypothetical protein
LGQTPTSDGVTPIRAVGKAVLVLGVVVVLLTVLRQNLPDLVTGFLEGLQVGAE